MKKKSNRSYFNKKYMNEIKSLLPMVTKREKTYLNKLQINIDEALENQDFPEPQTIEDFYSAFGDPYDVVHQFFTNLEKDSFEEIINARKIKKAALSITVGLCIILSLFAFFLLGIEHKSFTDSEIQIITYQISE